jgi:hypothetical protein
MPPPPKKKVVAGIPPKNAPYDANVATVGDP